MCPSTPHHSAQAGEEHRDKSDKNLHPNQIKKALLATVMGMLRPRLSFKRLETLSPL